MSNINTYVVYMRKVSENLKQNYNCDMYYLSVNPVNSAMIRSIWRCVREQKHRWRLLIRQSIRNCAVAAIVRLLILIPVRIFRNMDGSATVMMQEFMTDFIIRLKQLFVFMTTVSGS